jgi:hypothetical protein
MNCIAALTHSIEQAPKSDPALERWLDRAKELQRELALRVLTLSRYVEELPEESYSTYAEAVANVLQDPEMEIRVNQMSDLKKTLGEFVTRLKQKGHNDKAEAVMVALEKVGRP